MGNRLSHFAVHVDDMDRAREFYESVFGWKTKPYWGPGFVQIFPGDDPDGDVMGALQGRSFNVASEKVIGFECTISVDNLDAVLAEVVSHGGTILMPKVAIPTVGWISKFTDSEGNLVCAMKYDSSAA